MDVLVHDDCRFAVRYDSEKSIAFYGGLIACTDVNPRFKWAAIWIFNNAERLAELAFKQLGRTSLTENERAELIKLSKEFREIQRQPGLDTKSITL